MALAAADPVIAVEALLFDYPGLRALDGVSFSIRRGTITALVGPNGAGKTTLLNCIAGLVLPGAGRVIVDGIDVNRAPREAHARMGYLADSFGVYGELTVERCLDYWARAQGIATAGRKAAVERAAARLEIADRLQQRAGELSRGLRQRLAIAQAIVHEPAVVLMDEPASGLDPEARFGLAAVLRNLSGAGMTLIVSSHILAELEDYSTDLLVLEGGRILEHRALGESAGEGADAASIRIELELAADDGNLPAILAAAGAGDIRVEGRTARFSLPGGIGAQAALLRRLVGEGAPVASFMPVRTDLQDAYLALLKESRKG
ncbi:MAG: ABC transporter ATP-binding protein [Dongiaceae bacterium]